jgi:hypothetical protein
LLQVSATHLQLVCMGARLLLELLRFGIQGLLELQQLLRMFLLGLLVCCPLCRCFMPCCVKLGL